MPGQRIWCVHRFLDRQLTVVALRFLVFSIIWIGNNKFQVRNVVVAGIDVNPTGELALLRYAFAGLIDASLALGRDAELRERWNATLCHLAPWNVGERGGQEVFLGALLFCSHAIS